MAGFAGWSDVCCGLGLLTCCGWSAADSVTCPRELMVCMPSSIPANVGQADEAHLLKTITVCSVVYTSAVTGGRVTDVSHQ